MLSRALTEEEAARCLIDVQYISGRVDITPKLLTLELLQPKFCCQIVHLTAHVSKKVSNMTHRVLASN